MQRNFESLRWFQLSLRTFVVYDGEIVERNEHPDFGCISILLVGENASAKTAAFYESMKFGRNVL